MDKFHMVLPFAIAIIRDAQGRYLIGRHPDWESKPYPNLWDMPGGKAKEGEDFEKTLIREVKEETGLDVIEATLITVFHHSGKNIKRCASPSTVPGIGICYGVEVTGNLRPTELEDMHWATLEELKKLDLTPWLEYLLENFLQD